MFVLAIVVFQLLVDMTILLNVVVVRQALGLVYLTIVPGAILLIFLRHDGLDFAEKFLFSVGLSIVSVMFIGLILNNIGLLFQQPTLSTPTLLITTNTLVFSLCALCYFIKKNVQLSKTKLDFNLLSTLSLGLPILAAVGTTLVNSNGNSAILLVLIGIIASLVLASSIIKGINRPLILFTISVAVLFFGSLVSNYIIGYDSHPAYNVFKITQENGVWNSTIADADSIVLRSNQMLSVTILPTIYSEMLSLQGTWVFKIVYPLIFAFVPVGLYQFYQKYMGKKEAFVAAFVILASMTFFYELPGLPAQIISELFLILLLITVFHKKISPTTKILFFIIFSGGMIVSHYGVSYIFLFLIAFTWLVSYIRKRQPTITATHVILSATYVILFFAMAFLFYIYTSQSASFNSLVEMGGNIQRSFLNDLFNPLARQESALKAVGVGEPATSVWHWLGRIFQYAVQFFIILGIALVVLKKKIVSNLDYEYFLMSLAMLVFALIPLVAPSFNLLNVTRTYHISLLFLAPFFVMGGISFFSSLPKFREKRINPFLIISLVIISLFLFETGFVYELTGDVSYSTSLSKYRMNRTLYYGVGYLTESVDVYSAMWLHSNLGLTANTRVYADVVSASFPLTSYAVFPRSQTEILTNTTTFDRSGAYVYLRNFNTFDGKIFGKGYIEGRVWNTSDIIPQLMATSKIYTNGGTEIYLVP